MISQEEFTCIFDILQSTSKPFAEIASTFSKHFSRNEYPRIALCLKLMLADKLLQTPTDLIITTYLQFLMGDAVESSDQAPLPNTLGELFKQLQQIETTPQHESEKQLGLHRKLFILMLLAGKRELLALSPAMFVSTDIPAVLHELEKTTREHFSLLNNKLTQLQEIAQAESIQEPIGPISARGVCPIVTNPTQPPTTSQSSPAPVGWTPCRLGPVFQRPAPALLEIADDEVNWLLPDCTEHEVVWDYSMCADDSRLTEVRELFAKALKQKLSPAQQQQVLGEFEADANLVFYCGLTPNKLPDLVENNSAIAIDVLQKLMSTPQIAEYLSVLVEIEISLHSMEVVNELIKTVNLPKEFLQVYISKGIQCCEAIKDKSVQARLVRLFCVFLQSLISKNIIDVQDIYFEAQTFSINFSKIKEASNLYRLLKSKEPEVMANLQ